ncbi:MAG: Cys-tRNA(Pro) deacylase [Tissierellia bacterium]|nr:Cys-tRNA(Pro) deacylase [Tissierellia bacterium]
MGKIGKTNAMRILDKNKVDYNIISYDTSDGEVDGISVAKKIGKSVDQVYKTLVGQGKEEIYVFIIPVHNELDLKKAAIVTGEKKIELIHVKDILKITGYIRGGCSPLGMKKLYKTYVHESGLMLDEIIVSAGKIGLQIEMDPMRLIDIIDAEYLDLIKV